MLRPPRSSLVSLALGLLAVSVVAIQQAPLAQAATGYQPLAAPARLLDTRPATQTVDGRFAEHGRRRGNSTLALPVVNRAGVPAEATAVVLNLTGVLPDQPGFVTVYPCGQGQPTASNLNIVPGEARPNGVIATLAADGTVCLFTSSAMDLIVDVSGWFPTGSYEPLPAPRRVLETRKGFSTFDGHMQEGDVQPAATPLAVPIADRVGVPSSAVSVVLNVTVTAPSGPGFATVYPCGRARPEASNLNYVGGQTVANLVVAGIGDGGAVCVFSLATTHLVIDVAGVLPSSTFVPLTTPQRVLDTRPGALTADARFQGEGMQPNASTLQLDLAPRLGVPAEATAVVLNVTSVAPLGPGFLTVHPASSPLPNASNLNYVPGDVVPNAVVARLGTGGEVCLFNLAATHILVDVAGWLTGPLPPAGAAACPSVTPTYSDAEAVGLLVQRPSLHQVIGNDLIAVLACDVPNAALAVDPVAVATWANANVAPYFAETSGGLYTTTFQAHPSLRISAGDPGQCLDRATSGTGSPFTNVLVVDTSLSRSGFAGPGTISSTTGSALSRSPSVSGRGAYVGGGSLVDLPSAMVVAHEIGHSIHWPHSYTGLADEYDNPIDLMSGGAPVPFSLASQFPGAFCTRQSGSSTLFWPCKPTHTLAFNRLAAGWVRGTQAAIHPSGRANYTLDRPTGAGVQLVALPDPSDPRQLMVLEARPAVGRDSDLLVSGVAVHLIRQSNTFGGVSLNRRHAQGFGVPDSYDHVIAAGATVRVHGVEITVLARSGDQFVVTVAGSYARPLIAGFAERLLGGTCADDVRAGTASCAL